MKRTVQVLIVWFVLSTAAVYAEESATFLYDDHGRRDPLWPLVTSSGAVMNYETEVFVSDLVLEGIIVEADGNNLAIVNGLVVKRNDPVGQYTVSEISSNAVVLMKGQEKFTLRLKKEE